MKIESENLLENLRSNKNFKNSERKNNSEVDKVGREKSIFGITTIPTQFALIQITPTRINPFHPIQQTLDKSMKGDS